MSFINLTLYMGVFLMFYFIALRLAVLAVSLTMINTSLLFFIISFMIVMHYDWRESINQNHRNWNNLWRKK